MPDRTVPKHPLPGIPDVASFFERFSDDGKCKEFLKETRWGAHLERFICPDCGHTRGWWLPNRELVECRDCHYQTSPTPSEPTSPPANSHRYPIQTLQTAEDLPLRKQVQMPPWSARRRADRTAYL